MISYPKDWRNRCKNPSFETIDDMVLTILRELSCSNLSLSGGIDSSLMLYYLTRLYNKDVKCYTIAGSSDHPDYIYANQIARHFEVDCFCFIPNKIDKREDDYPGDEIVRAFYQNLLSSHVTRIIACDGIDEITGGYYDHAKTPTQEVYYDYMEKLQLEQLEPLNRTSLDVEVLLPYMDYRLISLISFVPTWEKFGSGYRKKIIYDLAKGKVPDEILERRKYGFVDAMVIKN